MEFILRKGSNMKKRILCLALVMVMIFTLLPMSAFAANVVAEGTCGENLTWTLDSEGTLTISGTGAMTDYSYDSKVPWFNSRSSIKSAIIESGVTTIGESAFYVCVSLTSVTIPDSVTSIGGGAFGSCISLTNVTIPNSVTTIGDYAFSGCFRLTSVTIPDSVTTIGGSAFDDCSSLTSINVDNYNEYYSSSGGVLFDKNQTILICYPAGKTESNYTAPNSVTTIGDSAFYSCSSLTSVTIGNSVTSIGDSAFYNCDGLTSVTIPDSVTTIGNFAFNSCSSLTSVTIPDSVTSIGDAAFSDCDSLTSVTIGSSVTSIGYNAFYNCTRLTEINYNAKAVTDLTEISDVFCWSGTAGSGIKVTFGDGVEKIPAYLFEDCSYLTSVTIGNSVTSIGYGAFCRCSSLASVTIPDSVTSIWHEAFNGCSSLTDVYFGGSEEQWNQIDIQLGNNNLTNATIHYSGTDEHEHIYTFAVTDPTCTEQGFTTYTCACGDSYIDSYVDALGHDYVDGVCTRCGATEEVVASGTCGENLTWTLNSEGTLTISGTGSMTDYSNDSKAPWFNSRSSIKSAIIESGVTTIGESAFFGCSSLTSVTIPDSVTTIGESAFYACSSLTSVTIPNSVTTIGGSAFEYCSSLTSINVDNNNEYYSSSGGVLFDKNQTILICYPAGKTESNYTIPDSVTYIGMDAFYQCNNLTSVTIPNSVTTIGNSAFKSCTSLTSVTIGNSVTSIGDYAFRNCTGLTEINYNAKAVTDLTEISHVFYEAGTAGSGIKVTFGDGVKKIPAYLFKDCSYLTSVTIGNSVTSIGDSAFYYCYSLTSVTIPDSVTTIGDSAFRHCSSLTSVTIPDSVTSIGGGAFSYCNSLTSVTIPDSVTSIGDAAFSDCDSLTSVTIPDSVTSIGSSAFSNCYGLTKVTIPDSVTSIGGRAFYYCTGLTEINYNAKAVTDLTSSSDVFYGAGTAGSGIKVTFGEKVEKVPDYLFSTQYSLIPYIREIVFLGNAPTIGSKSFNRVTTSAYYPYGNDTWTSEVMKGYGGQITWKPYSDAEAVSVVCNGKTSYIVGEELYTSSISVTIERSDGCIEKYNYASGEITLGEYDMSKSGKQSITVTCRGVTAQLNIYIHDLTSETMPANDYPESSHNYEDNLDKTYTYTADGAYALDVTFSNETEAETNIDYIYVNGTKYTGKELANKTVHINGDTLTIRLVSDGSDGAYGFSIDSIIATYVVYDYTDIVVAPTCTAKGYTTHTCACGDSYVDSYVDALGHSFGEWTVTTAPTCTEKGVETRYCSRCDATEIRDVDALGHALVHHDGKAATCTEAGWEAYDTCSRCDYTTYKEIPATGHSYTSVVTEPTCTAQGYTTYTCSCGDSYVADYKDALGHSFGEWTVTTAPTCTEKGVETRYCSRCDVTETREVDALGHALVHHDGKAATCTEKGWEAYDTCSRCDYTTYKEIPATGHSYTSVVTEPTCTAQGYTTYTCSCGDSYVADYKDALGHSFGEWTVTTAPTCTEKGVETRYCSGCDATETRDVDALGHALVHHDGKAATCTEKGWEAYDTCSRCDYTTYKEIPAAGHDYKDGVCTVCGAKDPNYKPPVNPFVDVKEKDYFYQPVLWAVENGITYGTSKTTFSPNATCTRAQAVTFLWRAMGSPEVSGVKNPFVDVKPSDYYYKAVLWAVKNGITQGIDATHFGPNNTVTRGQTVTFMWRAAGSPQVSGVKNPFVDVKSSDYYCKAVLWAVESGITNGMSATTFGPNSGCTRGQIVTFLYRHLEK